MSKPTQSPLFIIFLTVFVDLVGFGMIIPLSPYFAQNFGASPLEVGLLMAIYSGFQFVFSPFWGRLSDRIGRRPVLLISLLGAAISHLLFGLAGSLTVLFLARGFAGLFGANISTAMAYIADVTGHQDRSKGMGLIGAAFGLGFVAGPALGGMIAHYSPVAVAYAAAAICFFNFIWAYFRLPESLGSKQTSGLRPNALKNSNSDRAAANNPTLDNPTVNRASANGAAFAADQADSAKKLSDHYKPSAVALESNTLTPEPSSRALTARLFAIGHAFRKPVVAPLLAISFLTSFAMSAMEASLFLYVKDLLGWSLQTASFGFAYVGIAMAVNQGFLVRRLLPKWGEPPMLAIGTLLFSVSLALTALPPTAATLAVAMTLLAIGVGFVNPAVNGSISQLTSSKEQGETLGVVQSLSALARIFGPPLGGWLYAVYSPHAPFAFGAGFAFISFLIVLWQYKKLPKGALKKSAQGASYDAELERKKEIAVGEIGFYQLKNLVLSGATYQFYKIGKFSREPDAALLAYLRLLESVEGESLPGLLEKKQAPKNQPIVLICETGFESRKTASHLEQAGYINVYSVAGGFSGLALEAQEETKS